MATLARSLAPRELFISGPYQPLDPHVHVIVRQPVHGYMLYDEYRGARVYVRLATRSSSLSRVSLVRSSSAVRRRRRNASYISKHLSK